MSLDSVGDNAATRAYSPSRRVPVLHDGDAVVWDSLAIAEYLAERHAGMWPADPVARAHARSVTAEMHSGFAALRDEMPGVMERIIAGVRRISSATVGTFLVQRYAVTSWRGTPVALGQRAGALVPGGAAPAVLIQPG